MNKVILMGRLTRDPNVRYSPRNNSQEEMAIARYTLAVDRRGAKDGQQSADFISCVAFGRDGEFAEKYLKQGTKVVVTGRIQTGSYTNRDGQKVYTTDVIVEEQEFAESKKAAGQQDGNNASMKATQTQLRSLIDYHFKEAGGYEKVLCDRFLVAPPLFFGENSPRENQDAGE